MTYKDIIILLNAGYSKDEIDAMEIPNSQPIPQPSSANDAAGAPSLLSSAPPESPLSDGSEIVPVPDPPAMESQQNQEASQMEQLQSMFKDLITQLQSNNRSQVEMGARIIDPHESAIQTLRSISDMPVQNN